MEYLALPPLRAFHSDRRGERDEMQDEHVMLPDIRSLHNHSFTAQIERLSYYAVFDGHNGARASKFAAERLHKEILGRLVTGPDLRAVEQCIKRCFLEAYKHTDEQFLKQASAAKPCWKDGTTATSLLVVNSTLFVANLGDSRAILCRRKATNDRNNGAGEGDNGIGFVPLTLTKDHSPQMFEERMRIQKAGGIVKDGRILGQLEVSRSLGDGQYKNHGLSCVPDIKKCSLTENDWFILIACDGLWKTFSNSDVIQYIQQQLLLVRKDKHLLGTEECSLEDVQWQTVCSKLAGEAVRRGSMDNVTVLLVLVNHLY